MGGPWRFCRNCGSELRPSAQFCTACGHTAELSSGPETQLSTAPEAQLSSGPEAQLSTAPEAQASGGADEDDGGGFGSAATTTSAAVTGRESGYRSWPQPGPAWPARDPAGPARSGSTAGPGRPARDQGSGPGPDDEPYRGLRRGRSRPLFIGAIAVVVAGLAAVVLVVVHPFGHRAPPPAAASSAARPASVTSPAAASSPVSSSPSPSSSSPPGSSSAAASAPQQAATSLAALLARSVTDRDAVDNAYNDVKGCGPNLAQDAATFRDAASSRRRLLGQLASMPGRSALSPPMLGDLTSAWKASEAADDDFAAWAQDQVTGGCSAANQSDPHFEAADGPDLQATASKSAFIGLWNPVAQTYGLTTYQQNQL
jgi:hypothetical protein